MTRQKREGTKSLMTVSVTPHGKAEDVSQMARMLEACLQHLVDSDPTFMAEVHEAVRGVLLKRYRKMLLGAAPNDFDATCKARDVK